MGMMMERRSTRRYDLSLPIDIRVATDRLSQIHRGKTRDFSTSGVYFVIDREIEPGSSLDITVRLPAEITRGTDVLIRAMGKVVRIERRLEDGKQRLGAAATIERYDIVRDKQTAREA